MSLFGKKDSLDYNIPIVNAGEREEVEIEFNCLAANEITYCDVYKDQIPKMRDDIINVLKNKSGFVEFTDTDNCTNIISYEALVNCLITL